MNKAFGRGFPQFDRWGYFKDRYKKYRNGRGTLLGVCKGFARLFLPTEYSKMHSKEKGYVYFQDFMPNNNYDTRIVVIAGSYALAEKRYTRKGDFRASGSGIFDYENIDEKLVAIAFDTVDKLKSQSIAFDFIYDSNRNGLIVEISYGFGFKGLSNVHGYWTRDMRWHEGAHFDFCGWMVEKILENKY